MSYTPSKSSVVCSTILFNFGFGRKRTFKRCNCVRPAIIGSLTVKPLLVSEKIPKFGNSTLWPLSRKFSIHWLKATIEAAR